MTIHSSTSTSHSPSLERVLRATVWVLALAFMLLACRSAEGPDPELATQAEPTGSIRLLHRHSDARLIWTDVNGTSGDERIKPASGQSLLSFPVLEFAPLGGVMEVGAGEGYGVTSPLDGNGRKMVNGAEVLYLNVPAGVPVGIQSALLQFRLPQDSTQTVIIDAKKNGVIVDSQTLTVTVGAGQSTSERVEVTFSEPADQLSFRAPRGSRFGVRESTLTTVTLSDAAAGPLTPYRGELQLRHNHRRARVAWVNVADTTGTDEQSGASGLTSVDMTVVSVEAAGGVLEVGGGEGYGVKGDGDNGSQRKLIDGDESLTLSFPHAFTDANLKFRSGKGAAFEAVISFLGEGIVLETRTLSLTTPADKNVTDSMNVVFPEGTNGLRFEAASGQYSLVTSTFYTVFDNATGGNTAPVLELVSPQEDALYSANDDITLSATASDAEDGDIASQIVWTYTPDMGDAISLGTGASIMVNLPESTGSVSASVTDASGETTTLSARVTIITPPPNRFLTVTGSATCELNPLGGAFNANLLFQDDDGNFVNGEIDPLSLAFSDLRVVAEDGTELTTASLSVDSVLTSSGDDKSASIVILLDQSSSVTRFDRDGQRFEAAKALVERLRPGDEAAIAVIGVNPRSFLTPNRYRLIQPFTSDKAALNSVLDGRFPRGASNVYSSLIRSIDLFADSTNPTKAIVTITDGQTVGDSLSFSPALEQLQEQGIKAFSIGIGLTRGSVYAQYLQWLACSTGGLFTELNEPGGFDAIFNTLANELVADGTPLATTLSFDTELPGAGSYTLQGTARVEVDGSVVSETVDIPFDVEPAIPGPPSITSLNPASGPTQTSGSAMPIQLAGENLFSWWRVDLVGKTSSSSRFASGFGEDNFSDEITFRLPTTNTSNAGIQPITITTPFGTSDPVDFTYIPEYTPTVTLTADNTRPVVGETVTYTWQVDDLAGDAISCELTTNDQVKYEFDDCRAVTSQTHTFTRYIPNTLTGLRVTDENGIRNSDSVRITLNRAVPQPVIEALTPDKGPLAGGNTVVLSGQHFTGAETVKFDGQEVPFTVDSDTQITTTAPAGSGTDNVIVNVPAGGDSVRAVYRYVSIPVVRTLSPTEGFAGDVITMRGSSLEDVD
ncbi:MAG: IPT/TIG domain-containing protein [Deinococcota bacterium]